MFRNKTPIKVGKMFISGKQIATEKLLKRLQTVLEAVTERLCSVWRVLTPSPSLLWLQEHFQRNLCFLTFPTEKEERKHNRSKNNRQWRLERRRSINKSFFFPVRNVPLNRTRMNVVIAIIKFWNITFKNCTVDEALAIYLLASPHSNGWIKYELLRTSSEWKFLRCCCLLFFGNSKPTKTTE